MHLPVGAGVPEVRLKGRHPGSISWTRGFLSWGLKNVVCSPVAAEAAALWKFTLVSLFILLTLKISAFLCSGDLRHTDTHPAVWWNHEGCVFQSEIWFLKKLPLEKFCRPPEKVFFFGENVPCS